MSDSYSTQLPDNVYGGVTLHTDEAPKMRVSNGPGELIHAFIGGFYVAMSEANWRALFQAIEELDAPQTHRIVFDDVQGTAKVVSA
jgi:hypothetical protein